jgi:hypothetical protein
MLRVLLMICALQQPTTGIDAAKFTGVYRAAKTTEAAVSAGVNYPKLQELIQAFTAEVALLKDKPIDGKEREVLVLFAASLQAYSDSAVLWRLELSTGSSDSAMEVFKGQVFYNGGDLENKAIEAIVLRYRIPIKEWKEIVPGTQRHMQTIPRGSMRAPWKPASEAIAKAVALYIPGTANDSMDADAIKALDGLTAPK